MILDIIFLLLVVGVAYYVYLLINPSTRRWALDNVLYVAVVSFVGYQLARVMLPASKDNQTHARTDRLLGQHFTVDGGRRRRR